MRFKRPLIAAIVMGLLLGPVDAHAQVTPSLDQAIRTEAARMAADASRATSHASLQDDVNDGRLATGTAIYLEYRGGWADRPEPDRSRDPRRRQTHAGTRGQASS
jgi:hypothetical protein